MLTDQELARIQQAARQITDTVKIVINRANSGTPFESDMVNTAMQIAGVSMNRIPVEDGYDLIFPGKPSLTLTDGRNLNIHYLALPGDHELGPFLDALLWLGKGKELPRSRAIESLPETSVPAGILVLMASQCPHCPQAVAAILSLAVNRPWITAAVVDAVEFPDLAARYKVKSTPTTVVNEGFTMIGQVNLDLLAAQLERAGGIESLTSVLDSMIKSGRAEDAAGLLCREKTPAAILPIYRSKEFSVRIGALVAMEEALGLDPRALDPIVAELTALLFDEEVSLRGDTAELLGKIGNSSALPALRKAAQDPDPDVREAVEEAIQALEEKT